PSTSASCMPTKILPCVVRAFSTTRMRCLSAITTSVKVPPVSTEIRKVMAHLGARTPTIADHCAQRRRCRRCGYSVFKPESARTAGGFPSAGMQSCRFDAAATHKGCNLTLTHRLLAAPKRVPRQSAKSAEQREHVQGSAQTKFRTRSAANSDGQTHCHCGSV